MVGRSRSAVLRLCDDARGRSGSVETCFLASISSSKVRPVTRLRWRQNDPRLVRGPRGAGLSVRAVCDRTCRRHIGPPPRQRPGARDDLCAGARRLLHLLDLLWLGRLRRSRGARFPRHLCRADPGDRLRPPLRLAHRRHREIAEHHLGRRLRRRALRQERARGGAGLPGRGHRRAALHRPPAQGRGKLALRPAGGDGWPARGRGRARPDRSRLSRRDGAGRLRLRLRHAPYRRHRAPGRTGAGHRGRIAGQARRLPRAGRVHRLRAL